MTSTYDTIQKLLENTNVSDGNRELFRIRLAQGEPFTKKDGSADHINVFFLPYDKESGKIYLGHHKKADDWIPPGGHIEPGETPVQAAIREMEEELSYTITQDTLEPWNLSVKSINRPQANCMTHYDIWFLVHIPVTDFAFDPREYHDAGWFRIHEGVQKIAKNPDFSKIVSLLSR